ncbi:YaaR family protein [Clostridium sp. YIM B02505]|uniref:YaaR family protein n=1 Tax=Clostridium yunnanense TaxID=2800325 RepID=A0ABS1EWE9_9CLOT|nr:YaaR family protein [Clostridium yunnanense]MBK1813697.1 YaaR family protein [Clostridium yunnanense]
MEISRVGRKTAVQSEERKKIDSKKDFSQNFNQERQKKSEEQLKDLMDDIKKKGNRLVITKSYADVRAYKNQIKEYLKSVLEYMYNVKKDISFWQTQYFITVDTIDAKLQEITDALLSEEKDNISIASTVDEIQGLMVDIYK